MLQYPSWTRSGEGIYGWAAPSFAVVFATIMSPVMLPGLLAFVELTDRVVRTRACRAEAPVLVPLTIIQPDELMRERTCLMVTRGTDSNGVPLELSACSRRRWDRREKAIGSNLPLGNLKL